MPATRSRAYQQPAVWSTAGLIPLVAVLLAALVAQPWAPRYRLFVSKPLPDGSRYTFLYPAHLQDVVENGTRVAPRATQSVSISTMNRSESEWSLLLRHLGLSVPSPAEWVTVLVVPLKSRSVWDSRRSERWARFGAMRRNDYLVDARTRTQFELYHGGPATAAAQFEAHDPVIARSFRVLPPAGGVRSPMKPGGKR